MSADNHNEAGRAKSYVKSEQEAPPNKWLTENLSADLLTVSSLREIYHSTKSKFQTVDVVRLGSFGKTLLLDGKIQSSAMDEFIYHESLVHPAMLFHGSAKTVFVGGGGEGATIREVLRYDSVEKCIMVDIDDVVIETSKKFLQSHHEGAFEDKRLDLQVTDAGGYIDNYKGKFDVIILDLADPVEGGPCYQLYTKSFYEKLVGKLNPGGILVTQSGPAGFNTAHEVFYPVVNTLQKVFKHVQPYVSHVPSFVDVYAFTVCSNDVDLKNIDIEKQFEKTQLDQNKLSYLDTVTWQSMKSLPKYHRVAIEKETRVITKDNFAFIY